MSDAELLQQALECRLVYRSDHLAERMLNFSKIRKTCIQWICVGILAGFDMHLFADFEGHGVFREDLIWQALVDTKTPFESFYGHAVPTDWAYCAYSLSDGVVSAFLDLDRINCVEDVRDLEIRARVFGEGEINAITAVYHRIKYREFVVEINHVPSGCADFDRFLSGVMRKYWLDEVTQDMLIQQGVMTRQKMREIIRDIVQVIR